MSQIRFLSILLGILLLCLFQTQESLAEDSWKDWEPFKSFESGREEEKKPPEKSAPGKSAPVPPPPAKPETTSTKTHEETEESGLVTDKSVTVIIGLFILVIGILVKSHCKCRPKPSKNHKPKGFRDGDLCYTKRIHNLKGPDAQKNTFEIENQPYKGSQSKVFPKPPKMSQPPEELDRPILEIVRTPKQAVPERSSTAMFINQQHHPIDEYSRSYQPQQSWETQRPLNIYLPRNSSVYVDEPLGRVRFVTKDESVENLGFRMDGKYSARNMQLQQPITSSPSSAVIIAPPISNNRCNPNNDHRALGNCQPRLFSQQRNINPNMIPFVTMMGKDERTSSWVKSPSYSSSTLKFPKPAAPQRSSDTQFRRMPSSEPMNPMRVPYTSPISSSASNLLNPSTPRPQNNEIKTTFSYHRAPPKSQTRAPFPIIPNERPRSYRVDAATDTPNFPCPPPPAAIVTARPFTQYRIGSRVNSDATFPPESDVTFTVHGNITSFSRPALLPPLRPGFEYQAPNLQQRNDVHSLRYFK